MSAWQTILGKRRRSLRAGCCAIATLYLLCFLAFGQPPDDTFFAQGSQLAAARKKTQKTGALGRVDTPGRKVIQ